MLTKTYLTLRFSPPVASTPLSPVRVHKFSSFTCVNRKQVLSFTPYIVANNNVLLSHSISYYLNSLRNLETRELTRHFVANNSKSVINSSCSSLECSSIVGNVCDNLIKIKNKIFQVLASLLLFAILVMCIPYLQGSVACASSSFPSLFFSSSDSKEEADTSKAPFAKFRRRKTRRLNKPRVSPRNENESLPTITSSENDSLPNIICSDESPCKDLCVEIPHTTADCDTGTTQSSSRSFLNFKHIFPSPIAETIEDIVFVILVLFSIPLALSLISGFRYFLQLCESDKKTVLMLQVGILDKSGKLRRQLAQIEDTFHFDDLKLKEVVKALIQHSYSFRYAYVSAIQCLSDEEKNYGDNFAIMMRSISDDPPALVEAYRVLMFYIKSFAIFIHWGLRKTSKKINYDTKCSKGLFAEVLTRELAKYDKDEEALACIDGNYIGAC